MMEDIRKTSGFRMTNRRESLDIHHMRLVIPALATVHALSWSYKHHVEPNVKEKFNFLQPPSRSGNTSNWESVIEGNVDEAISVLDSVLGSGNKLSEAAHVFKDKIPQLIKVFQGDLQVLSLFDEMHRFNKSQRAMQQDKLGMDGTIQVLLLQLSNCIIIFFNLPTKLTKIFYSTMADHKSRGLLEQQHALPL
jgi:hypothetical protein